jgi:hypothetical protein
MYQKEYLYFTKLDSFRCDKNDPTGRLDPRELNMTNKQLRKLTIRLENNREIHLHNLSGFNGQFNEYLSNSNISCCSLHILEIEPGRPPTTFTHRLLELGEKALLIYDWMRFLEIIDSSIEEMGLHRSRGKVTYYNPKTYDGKLTLHHKDECFRWQNEYRILISPTSERFVSVNIPGLKKISCIINSCDLERLRVEINN